MTGQHQRLHAIVYGVVQGVSFRYYTARTAQALQLTGWVRNLPDGNVELMAEGPRERLDRLAEFLHRGPPAAQVLKVETRWSNATQEFGRFAISR